MSPTDQPGKTGPPGLGRWDARDSEQVGVALSHLESLAERALAASGDVAWEWDLATGTIRLSSGESRTVAEYLSAIQEDDRGSYLAALDQALVGKSEFFEAELRCRSGGSWRWVSERGSVLKDAVGRASKLVGVRTDIEARRTWEESTRALRIVAPQVEFAALSIGPDGKNEEFGLAAFGTSPAQGVGGIARVLVPDDRARFSRLVAGLASDKAFDSEFRLGDGSGTVWIRARASGSGQVFALVRTAGAEGAVSEMRRLDELVRMAAETATDALIIFDCARDSNGGVVDFVARHANRQSEWFTQKSVDQILGIPASQALDVGRLKRAFGLMRRAIKMGQVLRHDLRIPGRAGVRWYSARAIPMAESVALALMDITHEREAAALIQDQLRLSESMIRTSGVDGDLLAEAARLRTRADELAAENETLHRLASTDALTGVNNRREFEERLKAEVDRARRYGGALSLVIVDIDDFKKVNDKYGHPYGDKVLQEFARVIVGCKRTPDIVARYGGEEFVIILPQIAVEGAIQFSERVRAKLRDTEIGEHRVRVTGSFGCAQFIADRTAEDLISRTDKVQYDAKRAGKDRVYADRVI